MLRDIIERTPSRAVPVAAVILAAGCAAEVVPRPQAGPVEGRLITAEQIEHTGARNAWDALVRAHVHLGFYETRTGQPVRLSRRGTRSLRSSSEPLVIVNGTRTEGLRLLHDITAADIASIRLLGAIDATRRYGTGAGGGAILIELKDGRGH
jgi:hypothetical protein